MAFDPLIKPVAVEPQPVLHPVLPPFTKPIAVEPQPVVHPVMPIFTKPIAVEPQPVVHPILPIFTKPIAVEPQPVVPPVGAPDPIAVEPQPIVPPVVALSHHGFRGGSGHLHPFDGFGGYGGRFREGGFSELGHALYVASTDLGGFAPTPFNHNLSSASPLASTDISLETDLAGHRTSLKF